MSRKHVEEYYMRMTSDYVEMKRVLEELEKTSEENASKALNNINSIREQVRILESNYKRLSYIMFLLNQPNKQKKKERYFKREQKKIKDIPEEARDSGIIKQNEEVLKSLKSYL